MEFARRELLLELLPHPFGLPVCQLVRGLDGLHYHFQLDFRAQLFRYFLDFFQLHVVGDDSGFGGILKLREEVDELEQHLTVFQFITQLPQKPSLCRRSGDD